MVRESLPQRPTGVRATLFASARRVGRVAGGAVQGWLAHDGARLGAATAFYAIFALAPMLLITVAMAGAVFGEEAARGAIFRQLAGIVGAEAARAAEALIESAWREPHSALASALALGTLVLGATGVFAELRNALNTVWELPPAASGAGLGSLWQPVLRARLAAFALVLALGFLAIVSLVLSAAVAALGTLLDGPLAAYQALLRLLDVALSLLLMTAAFALLLRWLPARRPPRRAVWIGALTASLLFALGKSVFGLYLGRAGVTSAFGAAGSFVALILWVFYSTQVLLLGAELGRAAVAAPRRNPTAA